MDLPVLNLNLNPSMVKAPVARALQRATQFVYFGLWAIEQVDLTKIPRPSDSFVSYVFDEPPQRPDAIQENLKNEILGKGFRDLLAGVRSSLEETYIYLNILKLRPGVTSKDEFVNTWDRIHKDARRSKINGLLKDIAKDLLQPLKFTDDIITLYKARNCLEHHQGVVRGEDADPGTTEMTLRIPYIKLFVDRNDEEVEMTKGVVINEGEHLQYKLSWQEKKCSVGEQLNFTADEFHRIGISCSLFGDNLAECLLEKSMLVEAHWKEKGELLN